MNERADEVSGEDSEALRRDQRSRFTTAMDAVRAAAHGDITREELAGILQGWKYEPQYKTTGLEDDWGEERPNSFDAVYHAFVSDLIDERTYGVIARRLDDEENEAPKSS